MKKILIRVDSSSVIGSGHVIRCLTIAYELRSRNFECVFICRDLKGNLISYIKNKQFQVIVIKFQSPKLREDTIDQYTDALKTIEYIKKTQAYLTIVDHYDLDYIWHKKIKENNIILAVIDDEANKKYFCDLILNVNYLKNIQEKYKNLISNKTAKLFGPKYALIRQEFLTKKKEVLHNKKIKNIFIFFGGSDPDNLTLKALEALCHKNFEKLILSVVIGESNPNVNSIKLKVSKRKNASLFIQTDNISDLMCKSDLSIGAGGSTTWERLFIGLPSIVTIIADNQRSYTEQLAKDNYIFLTGDKNETSKYDIQRLLNYCINNPNLLNEKVKLGQELVNGNGTKLVADKMISLIEDKKKL